MPAKGLTDLLAFGLLRGKLTGEYYIEKKRVEMMFEFLLFMLNLILKTIFGIASLKDKSFKKHLKEDRFTIVIKTSDDRHVRYYKLANGKFSSKRRDYPNPDLILVWSNSSEALSTVMKLMKFSQKDIMNSILNAFATGKLKMEIQGDKLGWFTFSLYKMMVVYKKMLPFRG